MAVPFEQSIVNWILLGGMVAIMYALRYLVLLERRMIDMESSLSVLVGKVEQEERDILLEEKLIERAVLKQGVAKKRSSSKKRKK